MNFNFFGFGKKVTMAERIFPAATAPASGQSTAVMRL